MSVVFAGRGANCPRSGEGTGAGAEEEVTQGEVTQGEEDATRVTTTMSDAGERMYAREPELVGAQAIATRTSGSCIVGDSMLRISPALALMLALLIPVAAPSTAHADPRTSFLIEQLKSDDYRVRTQAALALGSSGDDSAVQPLCEALKDSKSSVKAAAATALSKLGKVSGLPCLEAAAAKESSFTVKSQLQKSAKELKEASLPPGLQKPPPPGPDSKYYVAIEVTNKSGRPVAEIEPLVRGTMQTKLLGKKGYAVAPKGETSVQGGQIVKGKKLKGFLITAIVEAPSYEGMDLKQVVRLTVWSYPGKALRGEYTLKLAQSNTSKGDTKSEDLLVKMCVEGGLENFFKTADAL